MRINSIGCYASALLSAIILSGCATTSSAKKGEDKIAKFQASRSPTDPVKSSLTSICPSVAASFDGVAVPAALLYKGVADKMDKEAAINKNRRLYTGFQNDVKGLVTNGKASSTARRDVFAKLTQEQQSGVLAYEKAIADKDCDSIIAQLTTDLVKIADALVQANAFVATARKDSSFAAISGLQLLTANKDLLKDLGKVTGQLHDAITAGNFLIQLTKEDKDAQKFMKDYPAS